MKYLLLELVFLEGGILLLKCLLCHHLNLQGKQRPEQEELWEEERTGRQKSYFG